MGHSPRSNIEDVHAFSLGVAATINFFLYGALTYFVLGKMGSRSTKRSKHSVPGNAGPDGPSVR
jgi:hypothetical protein